VILIAKPYLRKSDDRLHLIAQTEILLYLIAGHVFAHSPVLPGGTFDNFMSFVLIVMMLTFLAFVLLQGLQAAKKLYHDRKYRKKIVKKDEQDRFYGVQREIVEIATEQHAKPNEYLEKPFIDTIIPGTWWSHWPLLKFAKYRPKPIDEGRGLLRGLYAIDRRTLEPTLKMADDSVGMEGVAMEDNPLSDSQRGLLSRPQSEGSDSGSSPGGISSTKSSRGRTLTNTSKQAELRAKLGPDLLDAIAEGDGDVPAPAAVVSSSSPATPEGAGDNPLAAAPDVQTTL